MRTILVADDNAASRRLIREILEPCKYRVIEACDGRDALDKIRETAPDLVLLDIQMPGLDGFEVVQQVRRDSRFATLRVAALTAYAMRGDRERALAAGFDDYITKPIRAAALRTHLDNLLGVKPAE
jgi:CheY-like chemotaxis protein